MNLVQPIRDMDLIQDIIEWLLEKNLRDASLFLFGIYTGLRISDILRLRVSDVRDVETLRIIPKKQKNATRRHIKTLEIYLQPELRYYIDMLVEGRKDNEYLFKSRQGKNQPITRQRAYEILREVADEFGLEHLGTHSLRKTFGYFMYSKDKDVAMLQEIFGHRSQHETLVYIGVSGEAIRKARKELSFMKGMRRKKVNKND